MQFIIILIFAFTADVKASQDPIVETSLGKLIGSIKTSRNGREFYSFQGIPFAEEIKRFEPSLPVKPWTGIKNATEFGELCSAMFGTPEPIGSEQCLFVNVYTPNLTGDLNVMVWIHGGGFQFGSSNEYNPDYLLDEDIVLVTINYRLGALGFLSTGDNIVPGNNGLKDQQLALQWVKKEIQHFGGSPDKVTIFGESAGGASVNFHLVSPSSKGLFSNAIALSGSILNPWARQSSPAKNVKRLAEKTNCQRETMKEIVDCLREIDVKELLQAQNTFMEWFTYPVSTFGPVVEPSETENAFLTSEPYNLMKSGLINKVPYMTGYTANEGYFFIAGILFNEALMKDLNEEFNRVVPHALMYNQYETKDRDEISEKLKNFLGKVVQLEEADWPKLDQIFGERYIHHGVFIGANLLAKHIPVFPYVFSYSGEASSVKPVWGVSKILGVTHADDLQYLFKEWYGLPSLVDTGDSRSEKFSKEFVHSLVNFAKTGKAVGWGNMVEWKPLKDNQRNWYKIDEETGELDMSTTKFQEIWDSLIPMDQQSGGVKEDYKIEL